MFSEFRDFAFREHVCSISCFEMFVNANVLRKKGSRVAGPGIARNKIIKPLLRFRSMILFFYCIPLRDRHASYADNNPI